MDHSIISSRCQLWCQSIISKLELIAFVETKNHFKSGVDAPFQERNLLFSLKGFYWYEDDTSLTQGIKERK